MINRRYGGTGAGGNLQVDELAHSFGLTLRKNL
jgi:hypothetical protein